MSDIWDPLRLAYASSTYCSHTYNLSLQLGLAPRSNFCSLTSLIPHYTPFINSCLSFTSQLRGHSYHENQFALPL